MKRWISEGSDLPDEAWMELYYAAGHALCANPRIHNKHSPSQVIDWASFAGAEVSK